MIIKNIFIVPYFFSIVENQPKKNADNLQPWMLK